MEITEYEEHDCLTCPYCDFEFQDWWELWPPNSEPDDEVEIKCEICEKEFIATFHYIPAFSVKRKKVVITVITAGFYS